MGIFSSMITAVSGLRAQSIALESIASNIANSQTISYKRSEVSFRELVSSGLGSAKGSQSLISGQVGALGYATNNVGGNIQTSDISTHLAISGDAYFVIDSKISEIDNNPLFSNVNRFTRRGDFTLDSSGYLINGNGHYLKGIKLDSRSGNPIGSNLEIIKIEGDFLPAKSTTRIDYRANLPEIPKTGNSNEYIAGSELLEAANYGNDPRFTADGVVIKRDVEQFLQDSLAGGAITVYNANGAGVNIQLRWAKVDSIVNGGSDTWNLFYNVEGETTVGDDETAWQSIPKDFVFNADGSLSDISLELTVDDLVVGNANLGSIAFNFGDLALTQFSDHNGIVQITKFEQNGYSAGSLSELLIQNGNTIVGKYSNDQIVPLYKVEIVDFNAPNQLEKIAGETFAETVQSGQPLTSTSSSIVSGALEASNADIADEFSKLIITQRSYIANTRIVTTSDEMMQEVVNMKR